MPDGDDGQLSEPDEDSKCLSDSDSTPEKVVVDKQEERPQP